MHHPGHHLDDDERYDPRDWVRRAIARDDARPSGPYEHAATLTAGIGLVASALLTRDRTLSVLQAVLGGALLLRSASGRDGLRKWSGAARSRPPVDQDASDPLDDEDTDTTVGYTGA